MFSRRLAVVLLSLAPLVALGETIDPNYIVPFDHPAIDYLKAPVDDPIARLEKRVQSGEVKLEYANDGFGYLRSVLSALKIQPDSQMLVFSKTSFQAPHISPEAPRSLFFRDDVAVGFVQHGDVLEFAALDPKQGTQFYTLDNSPSATPTFSTNGLTCVQCHDSTPTLGVPGLMVRSVVTDRSGQPISNAPSFITDHRSSIGDRWGGWYVTGSTGDVQHLGNAVAENQSNPAMLTRRPPMTDLKGVIDTSHYLEPTSDVVALMTLEHQSRVWDLITRVGWDERIAEADHKPFNDGEVDGLLQYMLFTDETKLWSPVVGSSGFTEEFEKRGPQDSQGRSLRDFDLKTRMFKYPLSYMIYSDAFDALPKPVLDVFYRRLYDVLSGKDTSETYAKLSAQDRQNILEILVATKKGLPEYFRLPG
ncbi:MAG TPA: hypothetical protein VG871_06810 [Vicinamibacterales bacterium]|nr:hypothetical protein [Vicinamibacterales bacterium]